MTVMQTPPAATQATTAVLVNRHSGTVRGMGVDAVRQMIEKSFAAAGNPADIRLIDGSEISDTVRQLLKEGHVRRIIVGGGDGTLTSVAGQLAGTEIALGILPLGTMNMVAKVLGMAQDLGQALEQLQHADIRTIDAARAGEHLFLHHVSFGMQPRLVKVRERLGYRSRITKMLAGVRAFAAVMLKPQFQRLSLDIDGVRTEMRTPALIVSNNTYEDSMLLKQARLDEGVLGVYAVKPMTLGALLRLGFDLLRGRWRENLNVTAHRGREVILARRQVLGRSSQNIKATADGELMLFPLPLVIRSEPAALRMLVPGQKAG
ncbi:diacylglycerol/lipid kinase family protein [Aestuariivirga sp.]|uniref:diacylglycerol/lipid kinase family protein n=1 Tax=Aestuariivirga sp. TaxID=2650926 RepID=UPI003BAB83A0